MKTHEKSDTGVCWSGRQRHHRPVHCLARLCQVDGRLVSEEPVNQERRFPKKVHRPAPLVGIQGGK